MVKKRKVIQALTDGVEKLLEESVGKGFHLPQGNLAWNLQELTIEAKQGLSDANIAVVEEQINLEIEIITKEYQLQIEQAKINWELEKTGLLNTFAAEIATLELSYALKEEDINEITLEIENRKSVLLIAKTDLQVAIEALNKQLAEIEATTVGYEVLLIQARIATNTEKLKVIPYLSQLIAKEEQLLAVLTSGIGSEYELIDAKSALIAAKKEIIPLLTDKATKRLNLGNAQYDQSIIDLRRADLLLQKIENDLIRTNAAVKIGAEDVVFLGIQRQLMVLKNAVEYKRMQNQIQHISASSNADQVIASWRRTERDGLTTAEINSAGTLRAGDSNAFATGQSEREGVSNISIPADIDAIATTAQNNAVAIRQEAEISAKGNVTSTLTHLLGSV